MIAEVTKMLRSWCGQSEVEANRLTNQYLGEIIGLLQLGRTEIHVAEVILKHDGVNP